METHRHNWIRSCRGVAENPGCWDAGNGKNKYRSACACGACHERIAYYAAGRGPDSARIILPGEPGHSVEDVQTARAAMAKAEN